MDRVKLIRNHEQKEMVMKLDEKLIHAQKDDEGRLYHQHESSTVDGEPVRMIMRVKQEESLDVNKFTICDGEVCYDGYILFLESPDYKEIFANSGRFDKQKLKVLAKFYNMDIVEAFNFVIYDQNRGHEVKMFVEMVKDIQKIIIGIPGYKIDEPTKSRMLDKKPLFVKCKDVIKVEDGDSDTVGGTNRLLIKPTITRIATYENKGEIDAIVFKICKIYEKEFKNPFEKFKDFDF